MRLVECYGLLLPYEVFTTWTICTVRLHVMMGLPFIPPWPTSVVGRQCR